MLKSWIGLTFAFNKYSDWWRETMLISATEQIVVYMRAAIY
jgi:hypothetical protein